MVSKRHWRETLQYFRAIVAAWERNALARF